jgi:hypothetical protein
MGRLICEACTFIDVREVKRRGLLCAGRSFTWSWNRDGEPCGSISVRIEPDAAVLSFRSQIPGTAHSKQFEQRVPIIWTNCHLGGNRPWFRCSAQSGGRGCDRRIAILYDAGDLFACRHCCDLAYASQLEGPLHRGISRSRKLRIRLGGGPDVLAPFPDKPPRMHWRTYNKLRAGDRFVRVAQFLRQREQRGD